MMDAGAVLIVLGVLTLMVRPLEHALAARKAVRADVLTEALRAAFPLPPETHEFDPLLDRID